MEKDEQNNPKLRWPVWASILLAAIACGSFFHILWINHSGVVTGDAFAYVRFAQNISRGQFFMDGQVADLISETHEGDELAIHGPIWNTSVLPDGRTAFTIAMGYPLFLAAMLKVGGVWLYLHANFFLIILDVILFAVLIWEGVRRKPFGWIIASFACILYLRLEPMTLYQFVHPWREPLFYGCLLTSTHGLLRFLRGGRLPGLFVMAFFLGYACAIKEANVIYGVPFGLLILLHPAFRTRKRKPLLILGLGLVFLVGLSPLLIQNALATGKPWVSLQTLRATQHYTETEAAPGLAPGNWLRTLKWYKIFYYDRLLLFNVPLLLATTMGLIYSLRWPVGRVLFGMLVVHLALYLQWGNADYRHMYFVHFAYAFGLSAAIYLFLNQLSLRLPKKWSHTSVIYPVMAFGLVFLPSPKKWVLTHHEQPLHFSYKDGVTFTDKIHAQLQPNSLLLCNRKARDIMTGYAGVETVRLHDLMTIDTNSAPDFIARRMLNKGTPIYFLDNEDRDPKNMMRGINWGNEDFKILTAHFNLSKVATFEKVRDNLHALHTPRKMNLYAVNAWTNILYKRSLNWPDSEPAYLHLIPRGDLSQYQCTLNGLPIEIDPATSYHPIPFGKLSHPVVLTVRAKNEQPVPDFAEARLVGWKDKLIINCGADAREPDEFLFPDGFGDTQKGGAREFVPPFNLRVPVRDRPETLNVVGLAGVVRGSDRERIMFDIEDGRTPGTVPVFGTTAWFPIHSRHNEPTLDHRIIQVMTESNATYKLTRVVCEVAEQRLSYEAAPESCGLVLVGRLIPDILTDGPKAWQVKVNGVQVKAGEIGGYPPANGQQIIIDVNADQPSCEVEFHGAGILEPTFVEIGSEYRLNFDRETVSVLTKGFYGVEFIGSRKFIWTDGEAEVMIPITRGVTNYELELKLATIDALTNRTVEVEFNGSGQQCELGHGITKHHFTFNYESISESGLAVLKISSETWQPFMLLGTGDERQLGLQVFGLSWKPVTTNDLSQAQD